MPEEVVITGIGIVAPIGIGRERAWRSLCAGESGIGPIRLVDARTLPVAAAGEVLDFDARQFVKPRKNLKLMVRDSEMGVAASILACEDARLVPGTIDPERTGVIMGADRMNAPVEDSRDPFAGCITGGKFDFARWGTDGMSRAFPLTFLKVVPNMVASHVSITHDARGPSNTIHQGEVSGLLALHEASRIILRGTADVMLAGGASSLLKPWDWAVHCVLQRVSFRQTDPRTICRPFDALRDGEVRGEGAAVFVLERRRHAELRGATILARLDATASAFGPVNGSGSGGAGLARAVRLALERAGLEPRQVGHVNANGLSTPVEDEIEAQTMAAVLPTVPVTAPKSFFGSLAAAGGAMELAVSVMSLAPRLVPATLNYDRPDPRCPVRVIRGEPLAGRPPVAVSVNMTRMGQAVAAVVSAPE